jgi:hypothetical protein
MVSERARQVLRQDDDAGQSGKRVQRTYKSFEEVFRAARASGDDLERWVLRLGSVFWIPDVDTGFGRESEPGAKHAWVIAGPYQKGQVRVLGYPITSQVERNRALGLLLPAGVIPRLDRAGVILVGPQFRRLLIARNFQNPNDYISIGDLPHEWQERLRTEIAARDPGMVSEGQED